MKLYFENRHGKRTEIATVQNAEEAIEEIVHFCDIHKFKIHYYRTWEVGNSTTFDVGSHTEFFHLEN